MIFEQPQQYLWMRQNKSRKKLASKNLKMKYYFVYFSCVCVIECSPLQLVMHIANGKMSQKESTKTNKQKKKKHKISTKYSTWKQRIFTLFLANELVMTNRVSVICIDNVSFDLNRLAFNNFFLFCWNIFFFFWFLLFSRAPQSRNTGKTKWIKIQLTKIKSKRSRIHRTQNEDYSNFVAY